MIDRDFLSSVRLSIIDSLRLLSCKYPEIFGVSADFGEIAETLNQLNKHDFRQVIDKIGVHLSLKCAEQHIENAEIKFDINRFLVAETFVHAAHATIKTRSYERGKNREDAFKRMAEFCKQATGLQMSTTDAIKTMICLKMARATESVNYVEDDYVDAIAYVMLLAEAMATDEDKASAASYNASLAKKMSEAAGCWEE